MQRPTAQPYSSVPVPAVPPGTTLEGKLKALGIQRPGLGAADGVVNSMRRALGPAAPSGASPGPDGPASPAPGPGDLRAAERAVQRAAARLEAAASNLKQNLASALPSRLDARASAAAPGPAGQGGGGEFQGAYDTFLARERERWGQGSWRREHTRAEDPDTKALRASVEDAQVEAQRQAAEAKLMQLRREKGVSLQAELPASVAKREGVAPLGARAAAEEAKKQKAAATVAQEAQEARDRAAREASALGLAASAAAKAAGMQPGDLERVRATLERDMQAHRIGAVLPARVPPSLAPTAAASGGAAPVAPRPAAASAAGMAGTRSRGGTHDDPRKRREADAQAQRQRDAAASAATTYSTAALQAELEAEEAKAAAALAAAAVAAASDTHVPLAGPGVPQCNAPYAVRREDSRLEVGWTTGASGDDVAAFQLQVLLPVPGAEWATLTDTAQASPLILERLVPGCPYQLRVRAKGSAGTWGPYSAPATLCTTGTRPQQWAAPPQGDAPGDGGDAPPGPGQGQGHGGGEYEAMFMRTAAFMASGAATAAATAAGTWAAPDAATVEHIVEALGDDAEPGQREQALAACVAHVRATIRAIRLSGLPADRIRRELRALRVRYHPDKAQPHQQWLYAELSKLVNAETRE
jgi:hypothetical protein